MLASWENFGQRALLCHIWSSPVLPQLEEETLCPPAAGGSYLSWGLKTPAASLHLAPVVRQHRVSLTWLLGLGSTGLLVLHPSTRLL